MATKTRDLSNQAHTNNYPPLAQWLAERGAQCLWQVPRTVLPKGTPPQYIEAWRFANGNIAIILVHPNKIGWNIFTDCGSADIEKTLADADARIGFLGLSEHLAKRD